MNGTEIHHADVESVGAVIDTGRWLGSTMVKEGSNEILAAREQLAKLDGPARSCWPMPLILRWRRCAGPFMTKVVITC